MQVICTDGTRFVCDSYEIVDGGVKLFGATDGVAADDDRRYGPDTEELQIGFVPADALLYILPDGVEPAGLAAADAEPRPTRRRSSPQPRTQMVSGVDTPDAQRR